MMECAVYKNRDDERKVSIIMPTYNRALTLPYALASCLAQDYRPLEVVVVDDGSTDNTDEILTAYSEHFAVSGIAFIARKQRKAGAPAARNRALSLATGEFVAFLDSDDFMHPSKVTRQTEALLTGQYDFVFSEKGAPLPLNFSVCLNLPQVVGGSVDYCLDRRHIPAMLSLGEARKIVFDHLGPWDEALQRHQDWEYSVRIIASRMRCAYLPGKMYFQLEHLGERVNDQRYPDVDKPLRAIVSARARLADEKPNVKHLVQAHYRIGILACTALIAAVKLLEIQKVKALMVIIRKSFHPLDRHRLKAQVLFACYRVCPRFTSRNIERLVTRK